MRGTHNFSIIMQDFYESYGEYANPVACPLYQAFKRQFPKVKIDYAEITTVCYIKTSWFGLVKSVRIAALDRGFSYANFLELGEGQEFHTKITFL